MIPQPSPIRSPGHEPSGLQSGSVLVSRLSLTAFVFAVPVLAEPRCRAALGRLKQVPLSNGLAGLALGLLRTVVDLAGSKPSTLGSEGIQIVVPRRLTTIVSSAAYPVHLRASCLRVEHHSTTDDLAWASKNPIHRIQGEHA